MTCLGGLAQWNPRYIILWSVAITCVGLALFDIPVLGLDSSTLAVIGAVTAALTTVYQSTTTENHDA